MTKAPRILKNNVFLDRNESGACLHTLWISRKKGNENFNQQKTFLSKEMCGRIKSHGTESR